VFKISILSEIPSKWDIYRLVPNFVFFDETCNLLQVLISRHGPVTVSVGSSGFLPLEPTETVTGPCRFTNLEVKST